VEEEEAAKKKKIIDKKYCEASKKKLFLTAFHVSRFFLSNQKLFLDSGAFVYI